MTSTINTSGHYDPNSITITAQTLTGTKVTVSDFDIIIENGKPLIMFFVRTENGSHSIFNQHELTNYIES